MTIFGQNASNPPSLKGGGPKLPSRAPTITFAIWKARGEGRGDAAELHLLCHGAAGAEVPPLLLFLAVQGHVQQPKQLHSAKNNANNSLQQTQIASGQRE